MYRVDDQLKMEIELGKRSQKFFFRSPFDQLQLVGRYWPTANGICHSVLLIIHGSGEHVQRYNHMAEFFTNHSFSCVGFDWRGHGESQGDRGFIPHIDAAFDDLEYVIELIETKIQPGKPIIIYAHGTGSTLCLAHSLLRTNNRLRCQAMIISTPSITLNNRPNAFLLFMTRVFANLDPNWRLPVLANYKRRYSNDPEVVKIYRNDPLVHDRWAAMTVATLFEIGLLLERSRIVFDCRTLIQHGNGDTTTPFQAVHRWFTRRVFGNATFKEWDTDSHELHNDLNKLEIFRFILEWIGPIDN